MKRLKSLVLALTILLGAFFMAPIVNADNDLIQGNIYASGSIKGTSGSVDVEFTLPEENVKIYGIQFNCSLPKGIVLDGTPKNKIGKEWKLEVNGNQIYLYSNGDKKLTSLNEIKSDLGNTYRLVTLPVKVNKDIAPGVLDFKVTLTSVAIGYKGAKYGYAEGIGYCNTEYNQFSLDYIKSISGAKVSGIVEKSYTGSACEQKSIKVKVGSYTLKKGTDYTVSYESNKYPGKATLTIKGKNNYYGSVKKTFIITPGKIKGLKKSTPTIRSAKITWDKMAKVSGYKIYRSNSASSGYKLIKTQKSNSFTDTYLQSGRCYYYRVVAYKKIGSKTYTGSYSSIGVKMSGYIVSKPENLKVSQETTTSVKLTWKVTSKANGYEIYRSTKKDSGFKKVATIKSPYTTYYVNKKLKKGTTYYYRVYAYRKFAEGNGIGAPATITVATQPGTASLKSVKALSGKKAAITVKKQSGVDGYSISISTNKTKGYKTIYTGKNTSYTKKSLKANKTYYVKIRAYKVSGGKKIYGKYSKIKSVKIKK